MITTPVAPLTLSWLQAFGIGVLGALLVYLLLYRDTRLNDFISDPKQRWKILVWDLTLYLLGGGLVSAFLVEPKTAKEAFMGGCTWQGLAGGLMAGTELKAFRERESPVVRTDAVHSDQASVSK
jgi:hypothetical protein